MIEYHFIQTADELDDMVAHYLKQDAWSFDVETMGTYRGDPLRNEVTWISFACEDRTDVIPMGFPNGDLIHWDYPLLKSGHERLAEGKMLRKSDYSVDRRKAKPIFEAPPEQLTRGEVFRALEALFLSPAVKIAHNAKFDINSVTKYLPGKAMRGPFFDTQTADWVLNSTLHGSLSLDKCVQRHLGLVLEKGVGKEIERHGFWEVADYSALDARYTYDVAMSQSDDLDVNPQVGKVFDLEMQLLVVLADMERAGIAVDRDMLELLDAEFKVEIDKAEADCYRAAGTHFNLNSVQEKQRLLFHPKSSGGQGIRGTVLTPKGEEKREAGEPITFTDFSTSTQALSHYESNPLVSAMQQFSKFTKLRSTYTTPYLTGTVPKTGDKTPQPALVDGRIHTRYVQDRAETGRLSSRQPNLQNVPARSAEGMKIRSLFVPSPGYILVQADYSQIEPRIIADLSQDPTMVRTYMEGGDVYQTVAEKLHVDRSVGKTLVLAIAYGVGPNKIAMQTGMDKKEARDLMNYFKKQFPKVEHFKNRVIGTAKKRTPLYSETVMGRRRYIPTLRANDEMIRAQAERQAFNHVVQGSAADVMKSALVYVHQALPPSARMLLTVHDEIVTEAPEEDADETAEVLRLQMERAGKRWFTVPLTAEVKIAKRWSECKN